MGDVSCSPSGTRYAALCVMYWLLLTYPLTLLLASLVTVLVTALLSLKTLLRPRDSVAQLTCRDSALSHYVTLHCHAFRQALQLPVWFRNRHVQSLLGLWAGEPGVQYERKYLQLSDNGIVALDWELGGEYLPHGCPVLLVLPDLPHSALQVSALCREAFLLGVKAVVVNRRGQASTPLHTPYLPGYGEAGDLREVVDFLRQEGSLCLSAVGVGTGGDLLLAYLGHFGSSAHLRSAVCISPSYLGQATLHHGLGFPYSCLYLSHLKRAVLGHPSVFGEEVTSRVRRAWTLRDFDHGLRCAGTVRSSSSLERSGAEGKEDEGITALGAETKSVGNASHPPLPSSQQAVQESPHETHHHHHHHHSHRKSRQDNENYFFLHRQHQQQRQHESLEDFWAENEPLRDADEISCPVLCVSSLDDPVVKASSIQHDLFKALPNFFLLTLSHGGHAGFRDGLQGLSWAENAALDFVVAMLNFSLHHARAGSVSCQHACTQTSDDLWDFQCLADAVADHLGSSSPGAFRRFSRDSCTLELDENYRTGSSSRHRSSSSPTRPRHGSLTRRRESPSSKDRLRPETKARSLSDCGTRSCVAKDEVGPEAARTGSEDYYRRERTASYRGSSGRSETLRLAQENARRAKLRAHSRANSDSGDEERLRSDSLSPCDPYLSLDPNSRDGDDGRRAGDGQSSQDGDVCRPESVVPLREGSEVVPNGHAVRLRGGCDVMWANSHLSNGHCLTADLERQSRSAAEANG